MKKTVPAMGRDGSSKALGGAGVGAHGRGKGSQDGPRPRVWKRRTVYQVTGPSGTPGGRTISRFSRGTLRPSWLLPSPWARRGAGSEKS